MPRKHRQSRGRKRQADNRRNLIFITVVGLALLGVAGFLAWRNSQASPAGPAATATLGPVGQSIPVIPDRSHVPDGTDPGPFNSDPPTSGRHYAEPAQAGFYDSSPYPSHPEGHLVHNLEHGYVIFWYNCNLLSEGDCAALKSQIKDVMNAQGNLKLIAFPWSTIDVPLVMTSWGRLLKFETFDPQQATAFIQVNRNQAPEPDAP